MLRFTTDDLRPQDRFAHWCEVRGKTLFGVTIEVARDRRTDFRGTFSAREMGGGIVSHMQASSYRVSRTKADIARVPGHSLCIGLQVRGPGWVETGRDRALPVPEGSLAVSYSDLPFTGTPERSDGFDFRMLKIPIAGDILLGAPTHGLFPQPTVAANPFARPLAAMFAAVTRAGADLPDPAGEIIHMARLGLLARGCLPPGLPECRAAVRAGFLHAAREIMTRDLRAPRLSPTTVARELAISLRQVHVLFEPTGQSFARTLAAMRIAEACRLLRTAPSRSITDIAYACGFDSLGTFYRVFRTAHGMPPGDFRDQARYVGPGSFLDEAGHTARQASPSA